MLLYGASAEEFSAMDIGENPLSGVFNMNKAYNMMSGKPLIDQGGNDIIEYRWSDKWYTTAQGVPYHVPVEFKSIPTINAKCEMSSQVNEVYESTSTSVLKEKSKSTSAGYSKTVDLSASGEYNGIGLEASTSITNELMFGRSSTSISAKSHFEDSYSWSFSMENMVSWYQAKIDWDDTADFQFRDEFLDDVRSLNSDSSSNAVLSFIDEWGTHVMAEMRAGATCGETAYVKSSSSYDEVYEFKNEVKSNSAKFLFWSYGSEGNTKEEHSGVTEKGVSYSFSNIYCHGEVATKTKCGGLTGDTNDPVPVSYQLLSLFKIETVADILSSDTMDNINEFFENLHLVLAIDVI